MTPQTIRLYRLGMGLLQGLFLYLLTLASEHKAWPATDHVLFSPLILIGLFVPVLSIANLGAMKPKTSLAWSLVVTAALLLLGIHDVLRRGADGAYGFDEIWRVEGAVMPSFALFFFGGTAIFIGQALVAAGAAEGRRIASYPRYFDVAWKQGIQLVFSALFTWAFWMVLWMGTALFDLIHITFLKDMIQHSWFYVPATALAFAYAIHITDVRANLVRGIRTLALTLLSWLLPIMAAFVAIFMVSLPFQGLALLWGTHHASQILLGTAAWLIILLNAAYHDGAEEHRPGRALRYSGVLAAALLAPLVGLAIYAFSLRIGQHGWTVNMVYVGACLLVAACYAGGYVRAVVTPGAWLKKVEATNVFVAFVEVAVVLALFSPIADPARLAVADQVGRLERGQVTADKFDYYYLKTDGKTYGIAALERLKTTASGPDAAVIKKNAADALVRQYRGASLPPTADDLRRNITVYPAGQTLPDSFVKTDWAAQRESAGYLDCLFNDTSRCDAFIIAPMSDTSPQIVVMAAASYGSAVLFRAEGDQWKPVGTFSNLIHCKGVREALRLGQYKSAPLVGYALDVNGLQIQTNQTAQCPK